MVCVDKAPDRADRAYFPNGGEIGFDRIARLAARGLIIPTDDGLIPGVTQSYRVPEAGK